MTTSELVFGLAHCLFQETISTGVSDLTSQGAWGPGPGQVYYTILGGRGPGAGDSVGGAGGQAPVSCISRQGAH